MEIRTEVKTIKIEYQCPKCKDGMLEYTGICYIAIKNIFDHKCSKCHKITEILDKHYLIIEYHKPIIDTIL